MPRKAYIAIRVYLALALVLTVMFCFSDFAHLGHFARRENWLSLLNVMLMGAGNAMVPTGLVMLGVWSNSWFKAGIERRAQRRFQSYSGN